MEDQKLRQVEYHENVHYRADQPRFVDNSHPFVAWLNHYRLRRAVRMMRVSLPGKSMLSVCGGDGEEADFFQRQGARVTVADLSAGALEAARRRNQELRCCCMDAESLTFSDRSFDWALVRDGLHHLARPLQGLYELERVSREGFVILEGQDSLMVRLLSVFGIAENRDPAGGYVYRFSRRELHKIFASLQTIDEWHIHTAWLPFGSDILGFVPLFTKFIYPVTNQPLIRQLLCARYVRKACKAVFFCAQLIAGRWGNSLIVVARKKAP
jgi:ubiquinone/menaquinone biosynthesis C-methylase UbiE